MTTRWRRAPHRRPRRWGSIDHVVGVSSTHRGAGLAYLGRDGTVRASALESWGGAAPCLLFAADEEREIRGGTSPIGALLRDGLAAEHGSFPPSRRFETAFPLWLDWLLRDLPVRARDVDLVVTGDGYFATSPARLGRCLERWLPSARTVADLDQHGVQRRLAFWPSGFERAAVVTLDSGAEPLARLGGGRLAGTVSRRTPDGGWRTLAELRDPGANAGAILDLFRRHLGLLPREQGRLAAMAEGGDSELLERLAVHLRLEPEGGFRFLDAGASTAELAAWVAPLPAGEVPGPRHRAVALAARELVARIVGNLFRAALEASGCDRLAYAGGVAAHAAITETAQRLHPPRELFVPAEPGDAGQALGCALYGAYEVARWPLPRTPLPPAAGPAYADTELLAAARERGAPVRRPEDLAGELARRLVAGEVVARFAGAKPFGTAPPGARTLLADPRRPRPGGGELAQVAAVVLAEAASEWLEPAPDGAPPPRPARLRRPLAGLPGTVAAWPLAPGGAMLRRLVEAFRAASGPPLLVAAPWIGAAGAPVETPEDAVTALAAGTAGALALGPYLVTPAAPGGARGGR